MLAAFIAGQGGGPSRIQIFHRAAGAMNDVEDVNGLSADGEDDAECMLSFAVEQLAQFFGGDFVFGGKRASGGEFLQG